MNAYRTGQLTNAEVVEEPRKMADEIKNAKKEGKVLGLSQEEIAF